MQRLRFFLGSAVLLLAATFAMAQAGSIQGTVTDTAGAVVPGAEITVRSLASNATRISNSSSAGAYSIPNLAVGTYEVTVKMATFKTFRASPVEISVAQTLSLNPQLEPGAVSEEVEVRGDQIPDVDLETSQVSNLVDEQKIKELPLITRNPYQLVLLSPGTSQTDSLGGGFSVNGARDRNNNFLLDGVDNNDTGEPGIAGGVLNANPDSTQEFRVITDNFNAEFGRNNGAIIDVVTKSGTNKFHGGVYEFGRWNSFGGARDWFNRSSQGPMNPYVRNQFGGSIGGPIRKDKTFFFFNQEIQRFRTTLTNTATVPTPAFKTGVFTYTDASGVQHPMDLTDADTQGDNPFEVPLDPTMQKVFSLYPNPTIPNGDGFSGTLFFPSSSSTDVYSSTAKIDHHFTDRQILSLRYGYDYFTDPDPSHAAILPGGVGAVGQKAITQGLSAQLTSTLSTNLLNNFQFGWNHINADFTCGGLNVLDSPGGLDQFGNGRDYLMSPFASFACTQLGADDQFRKTGTTSYADTLSWVHGSHTFKFGFDFRDIGESGANNFNARRQVTTDAIFLFGSDFVGLTDNIPGGAEPIQDAALALWGFVIQDQAAEFFNKNQDREATNDKFFRQHEYDWFAQDTWKVRRNLTLTLGLRYQLNGVPYEENGNVSNLLTDPASFPVVFSTVGPGTGKSLFHTDYSNIEPRVGFSWDPWSNGKTSIRAAFGIFHDRIFGDIFTRVGALPPFEQDYLNFPVDTIGNALGDPFDSGGFPAVPPPQTPSASVPDGTALPNTTILDPRLRNPIANNWNFGVQRDLPGNNTLDVTYVGSMGTHVWSHRDGNPPVPALVQQLVQFCSNPNNSFSNEFTTANFGGPNTCTPADVSSDNLYQGLEFGTLPFNAVPHNALLQPAYQQTVFNSIYHGLQSKFTHRFSRGLQLQGAYTYSHSIDNSMDPFGGAIGAHTFPRNSLNLAEGRGNSDYDIRHVGVVSYLWEMPFGKGKSYLNTGVLGKIFEGIQLAGVTTLQTGHPFQVRSSLDSQRTGIPAWGAQVGDPFAPPATPACAPNPSLGKVYVTNSCAFAAPPFGSAGSGRNEFYGPGFWNFDLSFSKRMKLSERFELETRFEGYNIFNHPHFVNPGNPDDNGNLIESSLFGIITNTYTQPDGTTSARQLQVAMKLNF